MTSHSDTPEAERPWTLADRYAVAHTLAAQGKSRDVIMRLTGLTEYTATCIVNKHQPGTHNTIARGGTD